MGNTIKNETPTIRECCCRHYFDGTTRITFVVRKPCYAYSLKYMLSLLEEAKRDFPDLLPEDVDIAHYAGMRYKRTYDIEFTKVMPTYKLIARIPKGYSYITDLIEAL